jgi:hypothetical protein
MSNDVDLPGGAIAPRRDNFRAGRQGDQSGTTSGGAQHFLGVLGELCGLFETFRRGQPCDALSKPISEVANVVSHGETSKADDGGVVDVGVQTWG